MLEPFLLPNSPLPLVAYASEELSRLKPPALWANRMRELYSVWEIRVARVLGRVEETPWGATPALLREGGARSLSRSFRFITSAASTKLK